MARTNCPLTRRIVTPAIAALVFIILLAQSDAAPAFTADRPWGVEGGWEIYWNDRNRGCFAEKQQANGTLVVFGIIKQDQRLAMGLFNEDWSFIKVQKKHSLKLTFDKKRRWTTSFRGKRIGGANWLMGIYDNSSFRNEIARSSALRVANGQRTLTDISLESTNAALKAALACHSASYHWPDNVVLVPTPRPHRHATQQNAAPNSIKFPEIAKRLSARANENLGEANRLQNEAISLHKAGDYARSKPLYRRSLAIRERVLGQEHPEVAQSLNNLGALLKEEGDYIGAELLYRRSLFIKEKVFGLEHPQLATTLYNLAILIMTHSGDFASAGPLCRRSLVIREKALGPEHSAVADSLGCLALKHWSTGKYAQAEPLYRRALAIRQKAFGPEHPSVAFSLVDLANLFRETGDYAGAEPLYRRSLAIREMSLGPEHPLVADSLANLAILLKATGDLGGAEPLYRRSLAIRENALGPEHPSVATSLDNLAVLLEEAGDTAAAEPLHRRSLAIRQKTLGSEHPHIAASLNNIASILVRRGDYVGAEPLYRRSLAIWQKTRGVNHPRVADSLVNLANLLKAKRDFVGAESLYRSSLAIMETSLGPEHPDIAENLNDLAILLRKRGRHHSAYDYVRRAATIHQSRTFRHNRQRKSQGRELGRVRHVFRNMIEIAWEMGRNVPARLPELTPEIFSTMQLAGRTSTGAALNQMAVRFGAGSSALSQQVRQQQDLIVRWQALDRNLIRAIGESPDRQEAGQISEMRAELERINQKIETGDARLQRDFPEFAELANPQTLDIKTVQALLGPDEALLVYLVDSKQTFIWAVTREGILWERSKIGSNTIEAMVSELRSGLNLNTLTSGKVFDLKKAHSLHENLVRPVFDLIRNKKHLLIVPSGALTSLPFHLLVTEEPQKSKGSGPFSGFAEAAWLVRKYATTTLPSVSSLRALRTFTGKTAAGKPFIGYGDPIFNNSPAENANRRTAQTSPHAYASYFRGAGADLDVLRRSLPRLEDTGAELRSVASILGATERDVRLRGKATERAVKQATLKDYRVVHFATHALVAGETEAVGGQAEPALALTLPEKATVEDDGLLMASEVAQLNLNADWVVLSACNTAAGDKPGAEALSGLARAFFYAGSRSLLVTHWNVESAAAVRLTTRTFKHMNDYPQIGRAEALRRSMLDLLDDTTNPSNSYPAIWAPFVVIGEGGRAR